MPVNSNKFAKAIIICGPTASGKTDFAHLLAKKYQGEIINCDVMQLYALPIITASPSAEYHCEIPYHLYNILPLNQEFSIIKYVNIAADKVRDILNRNKLPIIVGGSGMYVSALVHGYNEILSIDDKIRNDVRNLQNELGQEKFFKYLQSIDPLSSNRLHNNDRQRSIRACEVFHQTGKSIFEFHKSDNILPLDEVKFEIIFLSPKRHFLYSTCNQRLSNMFAQGALEEIEQAKDQLLSTKASINKALGIREILAYLNGEISFEQAMILAQNQTRQYAKRQVTWFSHQLKEKTILEYADKEEFSKLQTNYNLIKG